MKIFEDQIQFEWDKGNLDKNYHKHKVTNTEGEEVFFDNNKKVFYDAKHSTLEKRYIVFGRTAQNRLLTIVYSKRRNKIRIISARSMKKKERKIYEKRTDRA